MNSRKRLLQLTFAHLSIVTSLSLAALAVLDDINPRMGFARRAYVVPLAAILCVSATAMGVSAIAGQRGNEGDAL